MHVGIPVQYFRITSSPTALVKAYVFGHVPMSLYYIIKLMISNFLYSYANVIGKFIDIETEVDPEKTLPIVWYNKASFVIPHYFFVRKQKRNLLSSEKFQLVY